MEYGMQFLKIVKLIEYLVDFKKEAREKDYGFWFNKNWQLFNVPSTIDDTKLIYTDGKYLIYASFENGYFDILGLTDEEYEEVKLRAPNGYKVEW